MSVLITQGNKLIARTTDRKKAVRFLKHFCDTDDVTLFKPKPGEHDVHVIAQKGSIVTKFTLYRTRTWSTQ